MSKTILITGSTDGIGKQTAITLAARGHHLIIHGRNAEKLKKTVSQIKEVKGSGSLYTVLADLSDLNTVSDFTNSVKKEVSHIDVLINNAGVLKSPHTATSNGQDIRFVVNYLAPVLLTKALSPLLKKGKEPRIINLSSAAQSTVSLDALIGSERLSEQEAYAQSKLALTMWSMDLAKKIDWATTIAVNPGSLLQTKMVVEAYGRFWAPVDKGANLLAELATAEELASKNGSYFDNDQGTYAPAHPDAYIDNKIASLITVTNKILANYESAK